MNKEISKVDINKAIKDIRFRADQLDRIMMCACFLKAAFNERKKQSGAENE